VENFYHEMIKTDARNPVQIFLHQGPVNYSVLEHWHRSLEIDYLLDCNVFFWVNGEKKLGKAGDLLLINSRDIHALAAEQHDVLSNGVHGLTLLISYDFLLKLCPEMNDVHFRLEGYPEKQEELKSCCQELVRLQQEKSGEFGYLQCNSIIYRILYLLFTFFKSEKNPMMIHSQKYITRLSRVMDYIRENYQETLTLQEVSAHFGVSKEYLARIFKTYTGSTFKEYLNSVRLDRAFFDVIETDYSMLNIAMRNGFPDVRSFNNSFRKVHGMLPYQFRKEYAGSHPADDGTEVSETRMPQPHIKIFEKPDV